jgi:hypothetical protein
MGLLHIEHLGKLDSKIKIIKIRGVNQLPKKVRKKPQVKTAVIGPFNTFLSLPANVYSSLHTFSEATVHSVQGTLSNPNWSVLMWSRVE